MELNGLKVIEWSIDGEGVDAYFSEAFFADEDLTPLSNEELSQLTDLYPEVLEEEFFEAQIARVDFL